MHFSESGSYGTSILGNIRSGEFQLPRGISQIFHRGAQGGSQAASSLRNTLQRRPRDKDESPGPGAEVSRHLSLKVSTQFRSNIHNIWTLEKSLSLLNRQSFYLWS